MSVCAIYKLTNNHCITCLCCVLRPTQTAKWYSSIDLDTKTEQTASVHSQVKRKKRTKEWTTRTPIKSEVSQLRKDGLTRKLLNQGFLLVKLKERWINKEATEPRVPIG